jgi:hypothetical protein
VTRKRNEINAGLAGVKEEDSLVIIVQPEVHGMNITFPLFNCHLDLSDQEEMCAEKRKVVQPQPSTPHRAFNAFNDSIDNVNLEDIRDMPPGDHPTRQGSTGIAERHYDDTEGWNNDTPMVHVAETSAVGPCASDFDAVQELSGPAKPAEVDEAELVRELDACVSEAELVRREEGDTADTTAGQGGLHNSQYYFGPTQFPNRRRPGLLGSLRECTGPLSCTEGGCADRSCVEVAEALLLSVLGEWGEWGVGRQTQTSDDLYKVPLRDATAYPSLVDSATDQYVARGGPVIGGGVRGAVGYVLHTLLGLYYALFVSLPLQALRWAASLAWSATTSVTALAYVVASTAVAAAVWLLLLPLRSARRNALWLWQHSLLLAVDFLNRAPTSFGDGARATGTHKHAIPKALNGHVHKH